MTWRKLPTRSLAASAVMSLGLAVPGVVVLVRVLYGMDWRLTAMIAAAAGLVALIVAGALAYDLARLRTTTWRLTDDRLELRSGIAVRQHRSIPRDRVRSVDVKADPVRRAFGLTVVKVGTGEHAGERTELTLDPLTRQEAETLRRTLLRGEAAGHEDGPLAELRWSWIRYAPLSVWSFVGGALVLGALSKMLDWFGVNLYTTDTAKAVWEWFVARPWVTVPLVVAANAVIGTVGALLLFAETWGRYRLEREPGRLRLRRGLLTSRSLTLEERRLRGVELSEPLLLRLGGGARVKAVATGLAKKEEDEHEDLAALTPPMPRDLAERVATRIARLSPSMSGFEAASVGGRVRGSVVAPAPVADPGWIGRLRGHPGTALRRRVVRALATVAVLAVAAAVARDWTGAWVWAVPVVVLPVVLWVAFDAYRGLGHALGDRHLVTRAGSAGRSTVALDRGGIVGWTIKQSFFQRRAGLVTVSATTAAGRGHYDVVDVGRGDGLDLAAAAVPGLLEPFLRR
ncbi:PH domain-containing protein [Nonomuraea sediminis]|uniref:PH domain-containing protein n=1 Tax=Nonomuraea sediminis TaxID=2835864 RepID=UPI001BDD9ACA|nr:PH domain-containing protein [Nonomuraea sediminis]